eukprot:3905698-Prorocentrum_lima.AAC.1
MTSSLVGSEMCIRDRITMVEGLGVPSEYTCGGQEILKPGDQVIRDWPVSYTHLTLPTICSV